jgi:hypothetical protein
MVERAGVVAVPGPAGWQVQCPAAGVLGEAPGDVQKPAAQCARGARGRGWESEQLCPSEHAVRKHGEHGQGALALNWPEGKCASAWSLRSAMTCSTTAWSRCSASTSASSWLRLVRKQKCRQSGHSSA